MSQQCPQCTALMETWSEPDMDGNCWSFGLCPHCGCEIGFTDGPGTPMLRRTQAKHPRRKKGRRRGQR